MYSALPKSSKGPCPSAEPVILLPAFSPETPWFPAFPEWSQADPRPIGGVPGYQEYSCTSWKGERDMRVMTTLGPPPLPPLPPHPLSPRPPSPTHQCSGWPAGWPPDRDSPGLAERRQLKERALGQWRDHTCRAHCCWVESYWLWEECSRVETAEDQGSRFKDQGSIPSHY